MTNVCLSILSRLGTETFPTLTIDKCWHVLRAYCSKTGLIEEAWYILSSGDNSTQVEPKTCQPKMKISISESLKPVGAFSVAGNYANVLNP